MSLTRPMVSEEPAVKVPSTEGRRESTSRVASLDGLRAVSILTVIVAHFATAGSAPKFFSRYGVFGVQVFFVISGYIITTLLLREHERFGAIDLKAFYLRRFFRIVPAAYCYLAVIFAFYWRAFTPVNILSVLTFTSNYDLGRPPFVAQLWSLGVEEQFYILWPITLSIFFHQRMRILVWAICVSPLFILAFHFLHWNDYRGVAFPTTYDSLALGCLAAVLAPRLEFLGSRWFVLSGPLALLFQWPLWTTKISGLMHVFLLWPATHVCIAVFMVHAIQRKYWLLNAKPVVWIGVLSYSLYLWHDAFIAEPRLVTRFPVFWILGSATASYYLIERPFLRLRKRKQRVAAL